MEGGGCCNYGENQWTLEKIGYVAMLSAVR